jgi:cellulose 1,4-beta-cellobiosidase
VPHWRLLCHPYEHVAAIRDGDRKPHYVIRNDDYGHKRECIRSHRFTPNFTVVRSEARVARREPVAFPNVYVGCSWGVCSAHSGLPRRVDRVRSLVTSWSLRERARGVWAASYDIWFDRARHTGGQARGAEIMIWLSSRGFGVNRWPVVRVHHIRYHLAHWVTRHHGKRWTYIQFNRVHSTQRVTNLDVHRFIRVAEGHGLIDQRWWLTSVEAGFEIWRGGVGLKTENFSVRM